MTRPPTEMETRIASEIWEEDRAFSLTLLAAQKVGRQDDAWRHYETNWNNLPERDRSEKIAAVSRVIRKMREPTLDMVQCGHGAGWHGGIEGDKPCEEEACGILWKKMIDTASPAEGK